VTAAKRLWSAIRWRLKATLRLWRSGAGAGAALLAPEVFDSIPRGELEAPLESTAPSGETVKARGWALFPSEPTARVELWVGERPAGLARLGLPRPDIERLSANPAAGSSGFELVVEVPERAGGAAPPVRAIATGVGGSSLELPPLAIEPHEPGQGPELSPPPARTPVASGGHGLRLLVFTHQLTLGGAQLYLLDLLRAMTESGAVEATVVSAVDGVVREDLERLGIPVHVTSLVPFDDAGSHVGRVEELVAWASGREFEVALVNTATAWTFPGAEVAAELGIPTVWTIHESFPAPILWGDLVPEVRRRAEGALANAAAVVFEADATRRLYEERLGEGRGLTLPYGLDLRPIDAARAGLDRDALLREAGIPADAEVVLCVGTVEPRKAQLPLAQAFDLIAARHPRARLVFVGGRDDPYSEALAGYIAAAGCGERIELIPVTPDVQPWYGAADLLVCASDIESLPRTVLEGMGFETPVLATSVFGLPELIDDGETGWLCEAGDVRALAAGLDRALGSTAEERERIGRAARRLVERRHDLAAYGREIAQLLGDAAAGRPPSVESRGTAG
jgi:D-inositol-3-phosphate glycosyltransferase